MRRNMLTLAAILWSVAVTVQAHHSTTASHSSKTQTVTGVVATVQWTNPHVIVFVNVPNPSDPSHVLYAFESGSPNVLEGAGWNRTALKAGDKITIDYAPFRDGKRGGLWILGRRSDGTVLSTRSGQSVSQRRPPTQGAAPAASARCPRAEVVEVMPMASPGKTRPVTYGKGTIHVSRVPLSTLSDVVEIEFSPPWAIGLTFTPEVGERMQRMTARPNFPMAFVVDNDAMLSVVLQGGFGIGKDGLQITAGKNQERVKNLYDTLSRCIAAHTANEWGGSRGFSFPLFLLADQADDVRQQRMLHGLFHRIQAELGFITNDVRNVEAGVLIRDASFAKQLRQQFEGLVQSRAVLEVPGFRL